MDSDEPIGIIEISNENLKCLIFKIKGDNFEILSSSTAPSKGIILFSVDLRAFKN